jgi:hypothetical protein
MIFATPADACTGGTKVYDLQTRGRRVRRRGERSGRAAAPIFNDRPRLHMAMFFRW